MIFCESISSRASLSAISIENQWVIIKTPNLTYRKIGCFYYFIYVYPDSPATDFSFYKDHFVLWSISESVLDVLSFSLESSGVFMPSCPHCMYNRLIINDLYDNSKNICFHLYSHALTMFWGWFLHNMLAVSYIFSFYRPFQLGIK